MIDGEGFVFGEEAADDALGFGVVEIDLFEAFVVRLAGYCG